MAATGLPLLRPDVQLANLVLNVEQNAMAWRLAQEGYKEHAIYQTSGWYNGFHKDRISDRRLVLATCRFVSPGVGQKFNAMARYLNKLKTPELAKDLQVPLSNMTLRDDIDGFWSRVRRVREAVGRAEAEQLLKKPSLGGQGKKSVDELKRLLLGEAYNEKSMVRVTLAAEAALNAATAAESGDKHFESQNKPTVERWDEFRMSEKLGTSSNLQPG